jgi:hypothetical protein
MLNAVKSITQPVRIAARPYIVPLIVPMINGVVSIPRKAREQIHALDHWGGRTVFGNPVAASFNVRGRLNMRKVARKAASSAKAHNPIGPELRRTGCVHAPGLVDPAMLKPVIEEFHRAIENEELSSSTTNPFFKEHGIEAMRLIHDPLKAMPSLAPVLEGAITDIVSSCYGTPFICLLATPYRTYYVPPALVAQKEALSDRWHCDDRRTDLLKVFILLRDTDEDMGPFHALSRADTREAIRRGYRGRNDYSRARDWMESQARRLTGKVGDAMFCNTTLCLHRAGVPGPGRSRDQLELRFLPAVEGPGADWMEHMDLKAGD